MNTRRRADAPGSLREHKKKSRCTWQSQRAQEEEQKYLAVSTSKTWAWKRAEVHWDGFSPLSAMAAMLYLSHGSLVMLYTTVISCTPNKKLNHAPKSSEMQFPKRKLRDHD